MYTSYYCTRLIYFFYTEFGKILLLFYFFSPPDHKIHFIMHRCVAVLHTLRSRNTRPSRFRRTFVSFAKFMSRIPSFRSTDASHMRSTSHSITISAAVFLRVGNTL